MLHIFDWCCVCLCWCVSVSFLVQNVPKIKILTKWKINEKYSKWFVGKFPTIFAWFIQFEFNNLSIRSIKLINFTSTSIVNDMLSEISFDILFPVWYVKYVSIKLNVQCRTISLTIEDKNWQNIWAHGSYVYNYRDKKNYNLKWNKYIWFFLKGNLIEH